MTPEEVLQYVDHRPWPVPGKPWAGRMRWADLAFLHWRVDANVIRALIPKGLELDTFAGDAWLGIVPFRMEDVRLRFAPPVPTAHEFPELNVRTYVRGGSRHGVWFFSLDAASRLAVRGARGMYNMPYYDADMLAQREGDSVRYRSDRVHSGAPAAQFVARYGPAGPVYRAASGSLDYFLSERYCLFNQSANGELGYIDVHHVPWPLQPATATIDVNTMADAAGIRLPAEPPLVHFAAAVDVVAWNREPLVQ